MSKRVNAQDPHEESVRVVWHEPTQFDPLRHGPPYLPKASYEPVKLSSQQRGEIQGLVKKAALITAEYETSMTSMLAMLQALAMLHQSHHWSTSGASFFQDHLLFERLYNESLELIDQLAERIVGSGDTPNIGAAFQVGIMSRILGSLGVGGLPTDMIAISLAAETSCVAAVAQLIASKTADGTLSHGISKLLEDIADKHETFVYLLSQRSKTESYDFR